MSFFVSPACQESDRQISAQGDSRGRQRSSDDQNLLDHVRHTREVGPGGKDNYGDLLKNKVSSFIIYDGSPCVNVDQSNA